jgi:hypothetical protein
VPLRARRRGEAARGGLLVLGASPHAQDGRLHAAERTSGGRAASHTA